jgi:drug/metabolite transporter (DMT)-like permease
MPKWMVGCLLASALFLFIFGISQELTMYNGIEVFALALVFFIPCYIALFRDIAKRRLPYYWGHLMILLPMLGPFVYFLVRGKIKSEVN